MGFGLDDVIILAIGLIPLMPFIIIGLIVYYIYQFYISVIQPEVIKISDVAKDVENFINKEITNIENGIDDLKKLESAVVKKVENII